MLLIALFGTSSGEASDGVWVRVGVVLFLSVFILVGSFLCYGGIEQMKGRTIVRIDRKSVEIEEILFGKIRKQVSISRNEELSCEVSVGRDEADSTYLVVLKAEGGREIELGASLMDPDLAALYRWIQQGLGNLTGYRGMSPEMIALKRLEDSAEEEVEIEGEYRSKEMTATTDSKGWEIRLFGDEGRVFAFTGGSLLIVTMFTIASCREWIFRQLPAFGEFAKSMELSGEMPILASLAFGGMAGFVFLTGVFLMGFSRKIIRDESRLVLRRSYWGIAHEVDVTRDEVVEVKMKHSGSSGNDARYSAHLIFRNGKKRTLCLWKSAADVQQIVARVKLWQGD